jgi:hypothetical protein
MKHIKTYEELKPETYLSAADKLSKMGHVKRPEVLKSWGEDIKIKNLIKSINSIGQFEIEIGVGNYDSISYNDTKKTGQFYIYLSLDKEDLHTQISDWKEYDAGSCWLPLDLALVPVDQESEEVVESFNTIHFNEKIGVYFVSRIWLNLTIPYSTVTDSQLYEFGVKKPINVEDLKDQIFPSGKLDLSDSHEVGLIFKDRKNAIKFRKALIDIFEGNVDYRSTSENPGGLKDEIMDELYDEYELTTEELIRFINSIKKIRVNNLYKD